MLTLFLGDGKQPIIDTLWATFILICFIALRATKPTPVRLPKSIIVLWTALIAVTLTSTVLSTSIAYSVYGLLRTIEAFLVFYLLFALVPRKEFPKIVKTCFAAVLTAIFFSLVLLIFPRWGLFLPPINLVGIIYGHNHLAVLILFALPLALNRMESRRDGKSILIFFFILAGLFFTYARAALLLAAFYFTYKAVLSIKRKHLSISILLASLTLLLTSIMFWFAMNSNLYASRNFWTVPKPLLRYVNRNYSLSDTRFKYWKQAWLGFRAKPWLGSGPNTFFLISKRYQEKSESYSFYAHSFVLELMSDQGLIGLLAVSALVGYIGYLNMGKRQPAKMYDPSQFAIRVPLIEAGTLMFIYSFTDFSMNFLFIWLLFWAVLSMVAASYSEKLDKPSRSQGLLLKGSLVYITCFYVFYMLSALVSLRTSAKVQAEAFYLFPFNRSTALTTISTISDQSQKVQPAFARAVQFFHREDPEILLPLYQALPQDNTQHGQFIRQILAFDPKNITTQREYIKFLRATETTGFLTNFRFLLNMCCTTVTSDNIDRVALTAQAPTIETSLKNYFIHRKPTAPLEIYLARGIYLAGLDILKESPRETASLWQLASDLNPDLSYYHLELASLYVRVLNQPGAARGVLMKCVQYAPAATHCQEFLSKTATDFVGDLLETGFFEKSISEFPFE